jgi:hypothetical protein
MTSEFEVRKYLPGYLIIFRGYGTWLHGDRRGSQYVEYAQGDPWIEPQPFVESKAS